MTDWMTVSEYAKFYGKDPGNVRRMLLAGRLPGRKVGNQWIIPADVMYPDDRRVKSGVYKDWRKRVALNAEWEWMGDVNTMIRELRDIYGELLKSVILYGSYARGTQTPESDVDIALFMDHEADGAMKDRAGKCVASYWLKTDKVLSVIDIQINQYEEWKDVLPFYMNIEEEGIVLWQAA